MKEMFLNICRVLLGFLGISAVSACGKGELPAPEYGSMMAEYGTPYADYVVSGKVTDEHGEPLKGIAVTAPDEWPKDTVYTAEDGRYELGGVFFPDDEIMVKYFDVDEEENGGWFKDQQLKVALEKQSSGESWYCGVYAASEVDVKMTEQPDSESEVQDEAGK